MPSKPDIVLVANSPGELSSLVKPVAEELANENIYRVILVLTPCQYNSGKELDFVKTLNGISIVIPSDKYISWAFFGQKPKGITFVENGLVLFLGGDLLHAVLVAKRLGYPAFAYIQEHLAWNNVYEQFFVPDNYTYDKFINRVGKSKLKLVGNLMVDSIAALKKWDPEENVITFMPGSRQWEIDYMTPLYERIIRLLKQDNKELKFQLVNSPFVKAKPIEDATLIEFKDIHNSELVVTIPGTNTANIAVRGIPMVVLFPLNQPEVIPLEGLAGIIGSLPLIGKYFKRLFADIINKKTRFFALPNQKAGSEIVPEIRGNIKSEAVAKKIIGLLQDKAERLRMSVALSNALGEPGAARKIVEEINVKLSPAG